MCLRLLWIGSEAIFCSHRWTSAKDTLIHVAAISSPPYMSSYTCSMTLNFPGPAPPPPQTYSLLEGYKSAPSQNTSRNFLWCVRKSCTVACRKSWRWITTRNHNTIEFWKALRPALKEPPKTKSQAALLKTNIKATDLNGIEKILTNSFLKATLTKG